MIKIWKRIKTSDQQKIERILNKNEKEKREDNSGSFSSKHKAQNQINWKKNT